MDEWNRYSAENNNWATDDDIDRLDESNLTMEAVLGIMDMLRPGVRESIQVFKQMGVNMRIITADHIMSLREVAIRAGIITEAEKDDNNVVKRGIDFINDETTTVSPQLKLLARCSVDA